MKIARIVMDLGVTESKLLNFHDKWSGHKTIILKEFAKEPDKYISRINNIISKTREEKADIILFPACSIIINKELSHNDYLKMAGIEQVIITGCLSSTVYNNDENNPIKLIVNNDYIRFIEIEFGFNKKAYAVMMTKYLNEYRKGDTKGRKYTILYDTGDIKGTKYEQDELLKEATVIMNKHIHKLDYSKNKHNIDQVIQKLKKYGIASHITYNILIEHDKIKNKEESLFESEENIIDNYYESIKILKNTKILEEFDSSIVKWLQIFNINAMVAISSTITNIKKDFLKVDISDSYPPKNNCNVIAFDSGHHQYSGRYKSSIKSVANTLNKEYGAGQIYLAFWKYLNSTSQYQWVEPEISFDRIEINYNNKIDFIDIFDV